MFLFRSEQDKLVVFVKMIAEERCSQERLETETVAKAWSVNNYRLGNLKHHLQSRIVGVGKECVRIQYVARTDLSHCTAAEERDTRIDEGK